MKMKRNLYMGGEKVGRDDERLKGQLRVIRETYDRANDPDFEDVCTATSHLTGEKINRFTHIHQSIDDLLKKQLMTKVLSHRVGGCIMRCMGIDAMNAISVVTYEMDQMLGTDTNQNFLKYLRYWQDNDITANCAQTDTKGDRLKRPHQQKDPDLYLRIIESRPDGIIVRGAKVDNTVAPVGDEIVAIPTRFMTDKDNDYAVAFAIPADTDGVKLLTRPAFNFKRQHLQAPLAEMGDAESFTIFDDVFVPRERVFMDGKGDPRQTAFAGFLALLFAHYHRHSYTGCKPAVSEVLASAAALVAEYNGIEKEDHARDKISHLIGTAELVFAAGQMSAYRAERSESGTWIPDEVLTNAGRRLAGEAIYDEYKIVADLAGGLCAALPFEGEFFSEEVGKLANKYMMRNPEVSAENQHRCFRGLENMIVGDLAGAMQVAGLHGGGSPQMETISMMARYDVESLKSIAKYLFGIEKQLFRYERQTVTPRKQLERFRQMYEKK
ncbi:MAG: 4-hydroxyphenylacetate 3-hydroxylase N-terminal domain-containing protein [Thermodesulfobacteriota bacterium]|nr:4-hydroxyphenylacetate 3-hydroxylase N-terminal domain-containing protein [Thermodesulfobacteriota bacterium]